MPQVTLDLVSLDDKPLVGVSRRFEGSGGTIGRDEGNTMALPDAQRRVSRLHAAISFPGGVPTITNSSAVLPIAAGGVQLGAGQAAPLVAGMTLKIGPYVLAVRAPELPGESGAPPSAAAPAAPSERESAQPSGALMSPPPSSNVAAHPAVPINSAGADPMLHLAAVSPPRVGADPFADLLSGANAGPIVPGGARREAAYQLMDDPLAALVGSGAAPSIPAGGGLVPADPLVAGPFAALAKAPDAVADSRSQAPAQSLPVYSPPRADVIPEDFNPFELPSASARNTADPLSSLLGESDAPGSPALPQAEESIDALYAPAGGAIGDDILNGRQAGAGLFAGASRESSSLLAQPESSDPLALFGAPPAGPDNFAKPMRDDLAEIGGAYQPPRAIDPVIPIAPPVAPPAPAPIVSQQGALAPSAMPSYPGDALTRAFLAGADLPPGALPQGLTPEVMGIIGSLLRSATAGAIEMLAVRASIKREVQASVTIISSDHNNPLKFLPNAESVLIQLLGKRMRGFMAPDEAMKDAFSDLRAHELGVIAGTRAALDEVLRKFDPAILGDRLLKGSLLEKALPAMRKTKLWDVYLERYAQLRREVEDDFQSVFGKAFVAAYEAETARMKVQPPARGA
jgi:FHA domain-containing protein